MHTNTPANSIFDGPVTNLLSVVCSLIESFHGLVQRGQKSFTLVVSNLALLLIVFQVRCYKHGSEKVKQKERKKCRLFWGTLKIIHILV